jgi:hypothetical protein
MSLSVGSLLHQLPRITEHMTAYRPAVDSSSFHISLPVLVINLNSGILWGLSETIYQVPLKR